MLVELLAALLADDDFMRAVLGLSGGAGNLTAIHVHDVLHGACVQKETCKHMEYSET